MDRTTQQLALLIFLLLFYCAAPLLALYFGTTSLGTAGKIENNTLAGVLTALASDPGAYAGILNQMIVPVVAAVTAANHRNLLARSLSSWLFVLPLVTIFFCIVGALFFNVVEIVDTTGTAETSTLPIGGAIAQLFLSWAGTLAVYVMLLVGLSLGEKGTP